MIYPGGKNGAGVYQQIINQIPPHDVYIEAFLGSGAILRNKLPARSSIGIDADDDVIKKWMATIDTLQDSAIKINNDGAGALDTSADICAGAIFIHTDAISYLENHRWAPNTFVYCDPPYLMETRSGKDPIYTHEFHTHSQHQQLLRVLINSPAAIAISGYPSSLYEQMLANWRSIHYTIVTRGGHTRQEYLWMNYPTPTALHDYRYLGNNFRQRERLKRIRQRWIRRLLRMDQLERLMLTSAIAETAAPAVPTKTATPAIVTRDTGTHET